MRKSKAQRKKDKASKAQKNPQEKEKILIPRKMISSKNLRYEVYLKMFSKLHEPKYDQCDLKEFTSIMPTNSADPCLLELSLTRVH